MLFRSGKVEAKKATTKMPGDRVILKGVPLCALTAVHYAGVNVYDAKYHTTDDVLKDAIPQADFNPMLEDPSAKMGANTVSKTAKDFRIAAGPLPPDASGSSCQYEWSIRSAAKASSRCTSWRPRCVAANAWTTTSRPPRSWSTRARSTRRRPS